MEGVLARGDRRLSKAIYLAFRDGARFDSWSEHSFDRWKKAIEGAGLDMAFYNNRPRGKNEKFPWEHTSCGVSRGFLWKEYERAQEAALTPDCRRGAVRAVRSVSSWGSRSLIGRGRKHETTVADHKRIRNPFISHLEYLKTLEKAIRRARIPVAYSQGFNPHMKFSLASA